MEDPKTRQLLDSWFTRIRDAPEDIADIHIDQISKDYKLPFVWITATSSIVRQAYSIFIQQNLPGFLAGALSLSSTGIYQGINYSDVASLQAQLDLTPPSVYYFRKAAPWVAQKDDFIVAHIHDLQLPSSSWQLLHCEYKDTDAVEYRRSLWMIPPE